MPSRLFAFILLVLLCLPDPGLPVSGQTAKLLPVDEAVRDPSFFIFRARFMEAIQRRDAPYVLSVTAADIKNGFGGNDGVAEFKKSWKPEQPGSEFWKVMTAILALGGSFINPQTFAAPYIHSKFPDNLDAMDSGVIIGENVRVRQQSSQDSPVIATLSFDIVQVPDWTIRNNGATRWIQVKLAGGASGYVSADYIRSPVSWRAFFEKKDGQWRLAMLVSGD
ncbi:MAG: SH3 domain-containing protein [Blastocatellia bacterium]